ncbi:MAG: ATPase inhibitor subunit zeta [Asticcacaulis sp.]|uniref:ATPase inhibitor subunit zeta n=1 Tax=Asticcacaulis sp. TaxID=1872648 RepID=UPI003F7B5E92
MSTSHQRTPGSEAASDSLSDPAEQLEFQASGMRNRMLALWGAEKMGLNGASSENYAVAVENMAGGAPSEEDVIRKVLGDLVASKLPVRESEVRSKAEEFLAQARAALRG